MAKRKATVDRSTCVACGVCAAQCPRNAIEVYKGCYAVVDFLKCVGCGLCAKACPANAITISEINQEVSHG